MANTIKVTVRKFVPKFDRYGEMKEVGQAVILQIGGKFQIWYMKELQSSTSPIHFRYKQKSVR